MDRSWRQLGSMRSQAHHRCFLRADSRGPPGVSLSSPGSARGPPHALPQCPDAARQLGQFAVEALGFLEVRRVADMVVPGGLGIRQVARTCSAIAGSTTESSRPCVTSMGTSRSAQHVVGRSPVLQVRPARPPERRCSSKGRLNVIVRNRLRQACPNEGTHRPDVVGRSSAVAPAKWSRKPGPTNVPESRLAERDVTPSTKLIAVTRSWPCVRT